MIDFGDWDIEQLEKVISVLKPGESLEEFVIKAAYERYERRNKQNNLVAFTKKRPFVLTN